MLLCGHLIELCLAADAQYWETQFARWMKLGDPLLTYKAGIWLPEQTQSVMGVCCGRTRKAEVEAGMPPPLWDGLTLGLRCARDLSPARQLQSGQPE